MTISQPNLKPPPAITITQEMQLALPSHHLLEGFTEMSTTSDGVDLRSLSPSDALSFHTHNSEYHLVLIDPRECRVTVQGGALFSEPTEVVVRGATRGGSMLRTGWVAVGFQVELSYYTAPGHVQNVITSPIESFWVD